MTSFKKNKLSEICTAALLAGGLASGSVLAATAAGTLIKNLATVTYEDANGNQFSAQSNEALITVKKVNNASISTDNNKPAAAGQVVYSQHVLENTGNDEDSFTISVANATGDDLDAATLSVYQENSSPNGTADAGEQNVTDQTITLAAGEKAYLVVAIPVPSTATLNQTLNTILTVVSSSGTEVTDTGVNTDTTEGTVQTFVTLSNSAVVSFNKEAVLDDSNPSLHKITYTLTASNTGNSPAENIRIYDAIPEGATYVANSLSVSGLIAANGDTIPTGTSTLDEATLGLDLNKNGDSTDSLTGIEAIDSSLSSGQAVSLSFQVEYNPNTLTADDSIDNTGIMKAITDPNAVPPTEEVIETNPTESEIPQEYAIETEEGMVAAAASDGTDTVNDGQDDDGVVDDVVTVDTAPAGADAQFKVKVINNGNGGDTLELKIANSTFPTNTTFTFWNESGTVQLVDTNSIGGTDTGTLAAVASAPANETIVLVKAKIPSNATISSAVTADFVATSAQDPASSPISATTQLSLGVIAEAKVNVHDGFSWNELGTGPYTNIPGSLSAPPGARPGFEGEVGGTVEIPFYIDNESGVPDSYTLSAGSSWDGTDTGSLPPGWTVDFYKGDGSGKPIGPALSSTELLPGGSTSSEYIAVVKVPPDATRALSDYVADHNGDGIPDTLDGSVPPDGDGDVPIFIKVQSNSGTSDVMLSAVDVKPAPDITLAPGGNNQVQAGGSISYAHTLANTGNTEETMVLTSANSLAGDTWNNVVMVDTTGDGQFDKALSNLTTTDVIKGFDANGDDLDIVVSAANTVVMPAGSKFNMQATVYAPGTAAVGNTDIMTITATNAGTGPNASLEDVTGVIDGKVTLSKQVAYDPNCDNNGDGYGSGTMGNTALTFQDNLTDRVAPGECAVWEIIAENLGNTDAENTIIKDAVTPFSTFVSGSLYYGLGNGADLDHMTDGTADDAGELSGTDVLFYAGDASTPATGRGGKLVSGQKATVRFTIKVD